MASIAIREVCSAVERDAVFAFRYVVYVEEMGRAEPYADHAAKRIVEPLDATGVLFAAFDESGMVVGTARANLACNSDLSEYEEPYGMRHFAPFHPLATAIVTKLMVDPRYRRTPVAAQLARAIFKAGVERHVAFCFIDCNPHLKPFFERLGFRQVMPDFEHSVYGRVHPLVLDVRDAALLFEDTRSNHGKDNGGQRRSRVSSARHRLAARRTGAGGLLAGDQLAGQ